MGDVYDDQKTTKEQRLRLGGKDDHTQSTHLLFGGSFLAQASADYTTIK